MSYIVPYLEVAGEKIVARLEPGPDGEAVVKIVNPETGDDIVIPRELLEPMSEAIMKARRMLERCSIPGPDQTLEFTRGKYWFKKGKAPDLTRPAV